MICPLFQTQFRTSFMSPEFLTPVSSPLRHPLIKGLKDKMTADEEDVTTMTLAKLLFETSLIESGFQPEDTKAFSQRVYELAKDAIGVTGSLDDVEEEVADAEEGDVEEDSPMKDEL